LDKFGIDNLLLPENEYFIADHEFPGDNYPLGLNTILKKSLSLKKVNLSECIVKMKTTRLDENYLILYEILIDLKDKILLAQILSDNYEEYIFIESILNEVARLMNLKYRFHTFHYRLPYHQIFYGSKEMFEELKFYIYKEI
jgi:hypothetical protein